MKYSQLFNIKKTPQHQAIPNAGQVQNSAGGYSFEVDRWTLVDRFLILGSENGTYYIGAQKLTMEHAKNLLEALDEDGERLVARIVEISHSGRAVKNDPAIFALALASSLGNLETRFAAHLALPKVCRTGTHLFAFAEASKSLRGWGRGFRRAVADWYNAKSEDDLARTLVKFQARQGWSNRDLLRLSHPKPRTEEHRVLYKWAVSGELTGPNEFLGAIQEIRKLKSVTEAAALIRAFKIPREAVPTELLTDPEIWRALLESMPLTAMIRNLGTMAKVGATNPGSEAIEQILAALGDENRLRKARVHPLSILVAMLTYESGRGVKGLGEWIAVPEIVDALNSAFYASFANAESTGKRLVLGLDVSGSMEGTRVAGVPLLNCRKACGAMALVTAAAERDVTHLAFDTQVYPLAISRSQRLDDVVEKLARTGGGGTDCSAPIQFALRKKIKADAFIIYTDAESWYGSQHPIQALAEYRAKMQINAKLVIVAMAANRFSIGDEKDAGTLNVVGFDATVPQVISEFLRS